MSHASSHDDRHDIDDISHVVPSLRSYFINRVDLYPDYGCDHCLAPNAKYVRQMLDPRTFLETHISNEFTLRISLFPTSFATMAHGIHYVLLRTLSCFEYTQISFLDETRNVINPACFCSSVRRNPYVLLENLASLIQHIGTTVEEYREIATMVSALRRVAASSSVRVAAAALRIASAPLDEIERGREITEIEERQSLIEAYHVSVQRENDDLDL